MEALFLHLVDVHATVVVMMVGILQRMGDGVIERSRSHPQKRRARERLAEDGQERQKDHQLAQHAPILRERCAAQARQWPPGACARRLLQRQRGRDRVPITPYATRSNTAIDSTWAVCGNMFTTPAAEHW